MECRPSGWNYGDTTKAFRLGSTGGYIRKCDGDAFAALLDRHDAEFSSAIEEDETGSGYCYEMFRYELANHEFCVTYDLDPTLKALGLTLEDIAANPSLQNGLALALAAYREE
ncbi:MAG: hypothetical protein FWF10_11335 [Clostridiales bacterium]|nr:hypothetical protein [Clostridiales bacterium]